MFFNNNHRMYNIKSNEIKPNIISTQNNLMNSILIQNNYFSNIVIKAITGFGKTHVSFGLLKSLIQEGKIDGGIYLTPSNRITMKFLNDNLIQEYNNPSNVSVGYMIGKSCRNPYMCPPFWEMKKDKENIKNDKILKSLTTEQIEEIMEGETSLHKYCKRKIIHKQCELYNNMYETHEICDSETDEIKKVSVLRPEIEEETDIFFYKLNNPNFKDIEFHNLINDITERLKVCPYYFLRLVCKKCDIIVCDYQYIIQYDYIKDIIDKTIDKYPTKNYALSIDEFDSFLERLSGFYSIKLFLNRIEEYCLNDIKKRISYITSSLEKDFLLICEDLINNFAKWISEIEKNIEKGEEIEVEFDVTKNEFLQNCWVDYQKLIKYKFKSYIDDLNNYSKKHRLKLNELKKLLTFLSFYDNDAIDFIDFISKDKNGIITFEREIIFYRRFFDDIYKKFRYFYFFSATPPKEEILNLNIGENNYKIINVNGTIGKRKGVVIANKLCKLSYKDGFKDFDKKVEHLADVVKNLNQNSIVVAVKSSRYIENNAWNKIQSQFNKCEIKVLKCTSEDVEKENEIWNDFYDSSKKQKTIIFVSAHSKWMRGVNVMGQDKCRILIIWGVPYKKVPKKIIQKYMDEELSKYGINYNDIWYCFDPRNLIIQIIGRLIRGFDDYGCFIVMLDNFELQKILPLEVRKQLKVDKLLHLYNGIPTKIDIDKLTKNINDFFNNIN